MGVVGKVSSVLSVLGKEPKSSSWESVTGVERPVVGEGWDGGENRELRVVSRELKSPVNLLLPNLFLKRGRDREKDLVGV